MKRPWSTDDFFCFECRHFGGQDKCHRKQLTLAKKGWTKSCRRFEPAEAFRHREHIAEEAT